jgi:hypothetical protein
MNRILARVVVAVSTLAAADSASVINFVNPGDPPQIAAYVLLSITKYKSSAIVTTNFRGRPPTEIPATPRHESLGSLLF